MEQPIGVFRFTLTNGWTIAARGRTVASALRRARRMGFNVPVRHARP